MSATTVETRTAEKRYITVCAIGGAGHVEYWFVIYDADAAKVAWLRQWTADAYAREYGEEAMSLDVVDCPYVRRGQLAHGIEGVTFTFPPGQPADRYLSKDRALDNGTAVQ